MSGKERAILAIDEGTSGTRAALVAGDGTVSCLAYMPLAVVSPRHGVVEQDADIVLQKTLEVCRRTIAEARERGINIAALALATQRATAVLWDKDSGAALVPAVVWQDSRYAEDLKPLAAAWDERLIRLAGRPVGPRGVYYWAARHIEETPAVTQAYKAGRLAFGTVDTFLLWHLSHHRACVTTPTNAASTGGYVIGEHRYLSEWLDDQRFPQSLLPELKQDVDDFGMTRADLLGIAIPIKASCGDQQAALVGLGCRRPGQAMCAHGTGSFVDLITGDREPAHPGLFESTFTMTAWRRRGVSHFAGETYAATTGSALNWLCTEMRWFRDSEEIATLASEVSSSKGLIFMPTLTGLRQPRMLSDGRASLTGLSMAHSRAHLARAVLEGIAHAVASSAGQSASVAGIAVQEFVAGGDLSKSDALLQMQVDLSGIPLRRMVDFDRASLRGAAFLAGSDGILWADLDEATATLPQGELFMPKLGEAERRRSRDRWEALVADEVRRVDAGCYRGELEP